MALKFEKVYEFYHPILDAMEGTQEFIRNREVNKKIFELHSFLKEQISIREKSSRPFIFRLSKAKSDLQKAGYLQYDRKLGLALTEKGRDRKNRESPEEIYRRIYEIDKTWIHSLYKSSIRSRWCDEPCCTTCGAQELRERLAYLALKNHPSVFSANESLKVARRITTKEGKDIFTKNVCDELLKLSQDDIDSFENRMMHVILFDLWKVNDEDVLKLMDILEESPSGLVLEAMDRHSGGAGALARRRRDLELTSHK